MLFAELQLFLEFIGVGYSVYYVREMFLFFFQTSLLDAIMFKGNGEFYITNEDPGLAAIFATYPMPYVSIAGCIIDQACSLPSFN